TILPQFVGLTFGVYNGHKHIPVLVSEEMIGHKFGEFSPTRTFHGHSAGKKVATALADLEFSNKRISTEVKKALESAIANAENNHELDVDDLVVAQAWVGKDTVMKRFSPRARGRAGRIEKPFSNITIVVREVADEAAAGG